MLRLLFGLFVVSEATVHLAGHNRSGCDSTLAGYRGQSARK